MLAFAMFNFPIPNSSGSICLSFLGDPDLPEAQVSFLSPGVRIHVELQVDIKFLQIRHSGNDMDNRSLSPGWLRVCVCFHLEKTKDEGQLA